MNYFDQIDEVLEAGRIILADIDPADWAEEHRIMSNEVSPFPGPYNYDRTPYVREIVNCLSPYHDARVIAVMKGAQLGLSAGLIENGMGWIMSQNPGNILFLTGNTDLTEDAMNKRVDQMIESCGIQHLIRPNTRRKRNQRTGDTSTSKEFPGGSLVANSASNHSFLRQLSIRYGFVDDFDSAKQQTKKSGSTRRLIEQRFAAYYDKMKLFYISTPELKHTSNIEPVYLKGDQRLYFVPCPRCGEYISLYWEVDIAGTGGKEKGGITWKTDDLGRLIDSSVGYICQKCGNFFDDSEKYDMNLAGEWRPTAEMSEPNYYSYHISSLYAPPGMYDWAHYVRQYIEANPPGQKQERILQQTFENLVLGKAYESQGESTNANSIQRNIRNYPVGIVPTSLSKKDGNGEIVLLTCACDLNGTEHDARLDWEIVGWSESGSTYSIKHGSIGTFVPLEGTKKSKSEREKFSYDLSKQNNVWKYLDEIISGVFNTDTGRRMPVYLTGIDCGYHSVYAYAYLDKTNYRVFGLKGKDVERYIPMDANSGRLGRDLPAFRIAKERSNLYLVEVNRLKDDLADFMKLRWDDRSDVKQPIGFMNFPTPSLGLYGFSNYFEHFESEHRVMEAKEGPIAGRWVKKNSMSQNHFWDVRIGNMVLRDILVELVRRDLPKDEKAISFGWSDVVKMILRK